MAVWLRSHSVYAHGTLPGLTSFDVPRPASYVSGNVLVVFAYCDIEPLTAPSGWTQQASNSGTLGNTYVFTKIAGSSEPTTYTFSTSGGTANAYFVVLAVGGVASSSQVGTAVASQSSSTGSPINITVPGYTASVTGSAIWAAWHYIDYSTLTFTPPSGYASQFVDLDLLPTPICYMVAKADNISNGNIVSSAVGNLGSSGTKIEFLVGGINIASGSVDPYLPVFDAAVFDSVVFDTGPSGQTYTSTLSDALLLTDSSLRDVFYARLHTDDISAVDDAVFSITSSSVTSTITLTDAMLLAEAALSQVLAIRALSDAVITTDASLQTLRLTRNLSDAVITTDASLQTLRLARDLSDAIEIVDLLQASVSAGSIINTSVLSDGIAFIDATVTYVISSRLAEDVIAYADERLAQVLRGITLADNVTLSDALLTTALFNRLHQDAIQVVDDGRAVSYVSRTISDAFYVTELADWVYVSASAALYDVRLVITRARDDLILAHEVPLLLGISDELSLSHDSILLTSAENELAVGGY